MNKTRLLLPKETALAPPSLDKQLATMNGSPPPSTTPLDIHSGISDIPKIPKTYEGWLYESNGNWLVGYKKRYFVLSENQFVFRNKQKQGGVSTRCFLKLAILNPLPEKFPSKPKTEFKFRVQITVKKKKKTKTTMHYLCADTQEELDVWLSKFQEHIAYANRSAVPTDQPSMNGPPLPAPTTTHPGQYDAAKKMRLARLVGMTKSLSSTESVDELFSSVMSEAQSLLGADRSTLFIVDKKNKELWTRIATEIEPIRIPMNAGIVGQCVVKNTPLRIGDAYQCEYFNQAVDQKTGYKTTSVLAIPVCSPNGEVLGALQVINKIQDTDSNLIDIFDEDDEQLLATFCDHIAVAIGHCEKNESGQHQMSEGINRLQALQQQLAMAEQRENDTTKEQGRAKFMMELSKSLAGSLEIDTIVTYTQVIEKKENMLSNIKELYNCKLYNCNNN